MASGIIYGNTVNHWRSYCKWSDSQTETSFTMTVTMGMQSVGWGINVNYISAEAYIGAQTNTSTGNSFYSGSGATVSKDLVTKSYTVYKKESKYTVTAGGWVQNSSGYLNGTSRVDTSWSIPALKSYTISYNANGGSGAPGSQTKYYGKNITLSSTKPTRTGYSFSHWSTDFGSGSVTFNPGGTYTQNSSATLYANWTPNTYTVTYNANGGSGAPAAQTKTYGQTLTLSSAVPTRTNYNFKGWATSATGAVAYQPGANYTANAAVTLYAVWEIAYIAPTITNVAVDRCDSAGTISDEGTYLKVSFSYKLDSTYSGGMDYIQLGYKLSSAGSYTNLSTYTPTAMSGSFSQVIGGGLIDTEYPYDVQIIVKDHKGSSTITRSVGAMNYIIDFAPNGSVAVGKPADGSAKAFDIYNRMRIRGRFEGLSDILDTGGNGSQRVKILCKTTTPTTSTSTSWIHIRGTLGISTHNYGYLDILIPGRAGSGTTIVVNAFSPELMGSDHDLIVRRASDGYVYILLVATTGGWFGYDLFVGGTAIEIVDSAWAAASGTSGTDWFSSRLVKTDQFGGYPLKAEKLNGFYGIALPDKTRTDWFRTTYNGLIPYQPGTPSPSALGTSTWVFKEGWMNGLNWTGSGLKGRVMKQIWSGTLSEGGTITVSELPYYNLLAARMVGNDEIMHCFRPELSTANGSWYFGHAEISGNAGGGFWILGAVFKQNSATSLTLLRCRGYNDTGGNSEIAYKINALYGIL